MVMAFNLTAVSTYCTYMYSRGNSRLYIDLNCRSVRSVYSPNKTNYIKYTRVHAHSQMMCTCRFSFAKWCVHADSVLPNDVYMEIQFCQMMCTCRFSFAKWCVHADSVLPNDVHMQIQFCRYCYVNCAWKILVHVGDEHISKLNWVCLQISSLKVQLFRK